jgi:hypothetical protein
MRRYDWMRHRVGDKQTDNSLIDIKKNLDYFIHFMLHERTLSETNSCSIGWLPTLELLHQQLTSPDLLPLKNNIRIIKFEDLMSPYKVCNLLYQFIYDVKVPPILTGSTEGNSPNNSSRSSMNVENLYYYQKSVATVCVKYFQKFHRRVLLPPHPLEAIDSNNNSNSSNYNNNNNNNNNNSNNNNRTRKLRLKSEKNVFTFDINYVAHGKKRFQDFKIAIEKLFLSQSSSKVSSQIKNGRGRKKYPLQKQQGQSERSEIISSIKMNVTEYLQILKTIDERMKVYGYSLSGYVSRASSSSSSRRSGRDSNSNPLTPWLLA